MWRRLGGAWYQVAVAGFATAFPTWACGHALDRDLALSHDQHVYAAPWRTKDVVEPKQ
jgi:hypothetical protein